MRLAKSEIDCQSSINSGQRIAVEVTKELLDMVTVDQYKNPIQSIVRELLCNAIDSHRLAKTLAPVTIYAPTHLEPSLVIEDRGVGMSEETVYNNFNAVGKSTKTNSNTPIGGFGLGGKTPFTYTNQFTLVATQNFISKKFILRKNSEGFIECLKIKEYSSDFESGVTVQVPVKEEDIGTFCKSVQDVAVWFDDNIQVKGTSLQEPTFDFEGKYGKLLSNSSRLIIGSRNQHIRVGGVMYPLSDYSCLDNSRIILEGGIGEVDITISRESLKETQRTLDYVDAVEEGFINELVGYLEKLTYKEYKKLSLDLGFVRKLSSLSEKIKELTAIDSLKPSSLGVISFYNNGSRVPRNCWSTPNINTECCKFILKDKQLPVTELVKYLYRSGYKQVIFYGLDTKGEKPQWIKGSETYNILPKENLHNLSDLVQKEGVASKKPPAKKGRLNLYDVEVFQSSSGQSETKQMTVPEIKDALKTSDKTVYTSSLYTYNDAKTYLKGLDGFVVLHSQNSKLHHISCSEAVNTIIKQGLALKMEGDASKYENILARKNLSYKGDLKKVLKSFPESKDFFDSSDCKPDEVALANTLWRYSLIDPEAAREVLQSKFNAYLKRFNEEFPYHENFYTEESLERYIMLEKHYKETTKGV